MKALSELGISPWPWSLNDDASIVFSQDNHNVCSRDYSLVGLANRTLIAAAPDLYEALREAVIEVCSKYGCAGNMPEFKCCDKRVDCFVKKWRAALAKASGEDAK